MPAYPVSSPSTGCFCSTTARCTSSQSSSRDAQVRGEQKLRQPLKGEGWARGSAGDEAEAVLQNWGERQSLMWSYNWQYVTVYLPPISPASLSCNRKPITITGHNMRVDKKGTGRILGPCHNRNICGVKFPGGVSMLPLCSQGAQITNSMVFICSQIQMLLRNTGKKPQTTRYLEPRLSGKGKLSMGSCRYI